MNTLELAQVPKVTPEQVTRHPLGVIIVKVATGCDIACDYCYEYTKPDQSWRERSPFMEDEVMIFTAHRAVQHAIDNGLDRLVIAFHGGEPWLAERTRPGYFAKAKKEFETAKEAWGWEGEFGYVIQTNGRHTTRELVEYFYGLGIQIGVSLDGTKQANDLHRLDRKGNSTYASAANTLRLISEYRGLQATTVATMDLRIDALETYKHLRSLGATAIEFNMPHATWTDPPPGYMGPLEPMGYGDQLAKVFDYWWKESDRVQITLFNEIIRLLMGMPGSMESIGPFTPDVVTVRTDGTIDDVDIMSITAPGRMNLGLNVFNDSFDTVLDHPKVRARQMGSLGLGEACVRCPAKDVCFGGYFPTRYKADSNPGTAFHELAEFMNRSVYCADLYQLVGHIAATMAESPVVLGLMVSGGRGLNGIWRQLIERAKQKERDLFKSHHQELLTGVSLRAAEQEAWKTYAPKELPHANLHVHDPDRFGFGREAAQKWLKLKRENDEFVKVRSGSRKLSNA